MYLLRKTNFGPWPTDSGAHAPHEDFENFRLTAVCGEDNRGVRTRAVDVRLDR